MLPSIMGPQKANFIAKLSLSENAGEKQTIAKI